MRKIIAIGESVLDTLYRNGQPIKAMVGGRIANATASLGMTGVPVTFCSECCTDSVGDIIVDFFNRHQVATTSIDRYTDGSTQLSAIFLGEDGNDKIVNYGVYPDADRFDVVWPRIDEGDIVLFGSLYSIAQPQRERVYELLSYAAERKAVMVYLPGFQHGINFRITRVLTAILENLELSSIVVAHERDLADIFPGESAEKAYHNHFEYYCPCFIHIGADGGVDAFVGKEHWQFRCPTPQ
ncbi:MAG TPA: carbohydrate kinase, partial [Porphyromonadaceae bacterium]|nr:carbohydrate kinase [Porphyromonadaceae bacterium]